MFLQAFCLGHRKYVTSVVAADKWLLSGCGDGALRLWEPTSGTMISEIYCGEEGAVIQQVLYFPQAKKAVCLISGSTKLVLVCMLIDGETATLSHDVLEHDMQTAALSMCKHSTNNLIVLFARLDLPLDVLGVGTDGIVEVESCVKANITAISGNLANAKGASFSKALAHQTDFYTNLTKMNVDNVEEEMARKGKRIPPHVTKDDAKVIKRA